MPEKIIRDPVHDVVAFRIHQPVDGLLFRLLNAAEFQRLRRIRQLGMAGLAYPGADHSRYSHSLGVMETARKILAQLRTFATIDEGDETACLAAALLHDLGHGPFSHVFERVSGIDHERLTQRILLDQRSEVHGLLIAHDKMLPERVTALLHRTPGRAGSEFLSDILVGQLDADRMDYLLRDNLMTGSGYGNYDLRWLLHALTIDPTSGRLAVTSKGVSAVEAYLQARYHMYRNVYFHKVVRSAEGMARLALQRARRLMVQGRLPWPPRGDTVDAALTGQRLTMDQWNDLDDVSVLHCFKRWVECDDRPLATLCRGLLYRRLFKTVDLAALPPDQREAAVEGVRRAIVAGGGDGDYDLFFDEPADTPYESYRPESAGGEILVCDAAGGATPFTQVSPLTSALNRQLMFHRLHVSPPYADLARKAMANFSVSFSDQIG